MKGEVKKLRRKRKKKLMEAEKGEGTRRNGGNKERKSGE